MSTNVGIQETMGTLRFRVTSDMCVINDWPKRCEHEREISRRRAIALQKATRALAGRDGRRAASRERAAGTLERGKARGPVRRDASTRRARPDVEVPRIQLLFELSKRGPIGCGVFA